MLGGKTGYLVAFSSCRDVHRLRTSTILKSDTHGFDTFPGVSDLMFENFFQQSVPPPHGILSPVHPNVGSKQVFLQFIYFFQIAKTEKQIISMIRLDLIEEAMRETKKTPDAEILIIQCWKQ